jgi:hypothetical protein
MSRSPEVGGPEPRELWDPLNALPSVRVWLWLGLAVWACLFAGLSFLDAMRPGVEYLIPPDYPGLPFFNGRADFFQEWASARNLVEGLPIYSSQRHTIERYLGFAVPARTPMLVEFNAHPPPSVVLAVPLAWLTYEDAVFVWNLSSLAVLGVSVWLLVRGLGWPIAWWAVFPAIVLALLCTPLREHLMQGQLNLLILLLLVGTWRAERGGHGLAAGCFLGLATAIKLFPGFLFLYFFCRRSWKVIGAGLASLLLLTTLTGMILGLDTYRIYVCEILPHVAWFRVAWNNAALAGFWSKLLDPLPEVMRPWWRIEPLWYSPLLFHFAVVASCTLVTILVGLTAWRARTRVEADAAFGTAVTAMLLVSPLVWEHYLVLLVVAFALAWHSLPRSGLARGALLLAWLSLWVLSPVALCSAVIPRGFPGGLARPIDSLTVLSFQTYMLLGVLALGYWGIKELRSREPDRGDFRTLDRLGRGS